MGTRVMQVSRICTLFDRTFFEDFNTRLVAGAGEPLYEPGPPAIIYSRHDYAASALHEVAHWCIASATRRLKTDYGYWYLGDRGVDEQRNFEQVEARPQALEWIFSEAAGVPFRVSADNFDDATTDMDALRARVRAEVPPLLASLPRRAHRFLGALIAESGRHQARLVETYEGLSR